MAIIVFRDIFGKSAPDFQGSPPLDGFYWTDRDGSYAVPGLPGRGIVAICARGYEAYCYASGIGAENIPGAHVSSYLGGATGTMVYDTYPDRCLPVTKTALTEVNLAEGAESLRQDFPLVSASRLVGVVLDPAGKPLSGAFHPGFLPEFPFTYWRMNSEKFTINAYQPDHPRTVLFVHPERSLPAA